MMTQSDFMDALNNPNKDETKYFITERRNGWIIEDNKGRSAIGRTFEDAKANFIEALDREYKKLCEKVDSNAAEMKRKHRELWNYQQMKE